MDMTNITILTLDRYHALKKAEDQLKTIKGKSIIIRDNMWWNGNNYEIKTDNECIETLSKELKQAQEKISNLRDDLRQEKEVHKGTLRCLSKMGYWEFRKWKKDRSKLDILNV